MSEITLIFPDQLFEWHPSLKTSRQVVLAEEFLFFRYQSYHKQRLVLLRAGMQAYRQHLEKKGFHVTYIESKVLLERGSMQAWLKQNRVKSIHLADFADDWLKQDIEQAAEELGIKVIFYPSPMFLCNQAEIMNLFGQKDKFLMSSFYIYQRKKLNILMDKGKPVGGKYSFDPENRKKIPKGLAIPATYHPPQDKVILEAVEYIEREFPKSYGHSTPFLYPITFLQARQALNEFIKNKIYFFGDYEDAIVKEQSFLFHSVLSPLLNIGLLTPIQVIEEVLKAHAAEPIPLNSLEGFIRQIIGWREYMRASYLIRGRKQRTCNYFHHTNPVPTGFWEGETGLEPIDHTIKKIAKTGYCHHIERLMVLGNFLLLTETHPDAVYEWFMGNFVDAFDWVMVTNIYGMSQYADGGAIVTKPYISGSNYILKMSNYSKGSWVEIWDGLFWRFLKKHQSLFSNNPRTKVLIDRLSSEDIQKKIAYADKWLVSR